MRKDKAFFSGSFVILSILSVIWGLDGSCPVKAQTMTSSYLQMADSADYYIRHKQWANAERVIIQALRYEPANKSNFILWSNLGIVRENLDDSDGAIEAYSIGLSTVPKSTVLLTNRARAYLTKGKSKEALEDLNLALSVDSMLQWPLKMSGILNAAEGKEEKALENFASYEKLYGEDATILETRGDIYASRAYTDMALDAYRKAYRLEPNVDVLSKLCITAYAFGRIDEIEEDLRQGMKDYPREGILYLIRALLNKSKYQTDAYESDLKTALNLGVDKNIYKQLTGKKTSK